MTSFDIAILIAGFSMFLIPVAGIITIILASRKKKSWKSKIKRACKDAGTYKPYFDHVIDSLAGILERRDEALDLYKDGEEPLTIEVTNKSGFTNKVKNPLVSIWEDLDKTALSYWRDLGLTPAGLKKINEESFMKAREKQGNSLLDLLGKGNQKNE